MNNTVVLQFGVLPGTPPLDGPVPKGKNLGADFNDATQSAVNRDATLQSRRAKSPEDRDEFMSGKDNLSYSLLG